MYPANPVKLRPGRMAFCSIRKQEKHMCLFFVSCLFLPRKAINSFFILAFKERFTFLTFNARKYARFFRIILLQNSNAFVFYRLKSIFLGRKLYRKIEGVVKARFSESKKLAAVQVWHHFKIKIKKKIWWNVFWDRKSTRLNSSHANISYAVFCLKKKNKKTSKHLEIVITLSILSERLLHEALNQIPHM